MHPKISGGVALTGCLPSLENPDKSWVFETSPDKILIFHKKKSKISWFLKRPKLYIFFLTKIYSTPIKNN